MYKEIVRIYTDDIQNVDNITFWEEIKKRLIYANNKYNLYDTFYMNILISEMAEYSYFTNETKINGEWYLTYSEETTIKETDLEPELQFTKEDLQYYYTDVNNIDFTYIER